MAETSIQWTDHSVNPIRARKGSAVGHYCELASTGCKNCYSSNFQPRFGMPRFGGRHNRDSVEHFLDWSKLREVLRRRKPTKYFWCDMTDMFGEWVPDGWIDCCFATMAATPQHTHQVLTKRPERMAEYLAGLQAAGDAHAPRTVDGKFTPTQVLNLRMLAGSLAPGGLLGRAFHAPWPLPNVWLGTSVENQAAADERIPHLLRCPAAVRFLSCEPLLGPIEFSDVSRRSDAVEQLGRPALAGIHWSIVGGESGPGARECDLAWIRSIRDQCKAAGVPVFVKQIGARPRTPGGSTGWPKHVTSLANNAGELLGLKDGKGGDWSEWPDDLRIRDFPPALTSSRATPVTS